MTALAARLSAGGLGVPEVSVECTPTVIRNDGFDEITEIRPGNYVYMDRIQGASVWHHLAMSPLSGRRSW